MEPSDATIHKKFHKSLGHRKALGDYPVTCQKGRLSDQVAKEVTFMRSSTFTRKWLIFYD